MRQLALRIRGSRRFARTGFGESTLAELDWQRTRSAGHRWAWVGALVGLLLGLIAFAPATWLTAAVANASEQHLLLADARGTVWSGSAVPVLTGGAGSRDASALPGRLQWTVRPRGLGFELLLRQQCCLDGEVALRLRPGLGRLWAELVPADGPQASSLEAMRPIGHWPAAWLAGLGTPWNTLMLGGELRLSAQSLSVERVQGRTRLSGAARLDLLGASSRLATLDPLGDYRVGLQGDAAGGDTVGLTLSTLSGALLLDGNGQWGAGGVRFRGQASAAEGFEAALNNLLNIIGRRQGARSVISIG
jgi:general secretion pathway protein N